MILSKEKRCTVAQKWADENNISVHKAFVFRHILKKYIIPRIDCDKYEIENSSNPYDRYLLSFKFALYHVNDDGKMYLVAKDDWHSGTYDEMVEYANNTIMPTLYLSDYWAKKYDVPANAIQLLRINKRVR